MNQNELLIFIKSIIEFLLIKANKPICIAINGIEGTGKTTLAKSLTNQLMTEKINAIHVSIDGYHNNKKYRYKQGRNSAKGYYEDSYNETGFLNKVLLSSKSEKPNYTLAIHDLETDNILSLEPIPIPIETVLITDGAYLFKPIYKKYWDLKIYLKTDFKTALNRGVKRDIDSLGGYESTKEKYDLRYHKASKIYISENNPEQLADIVIDNTDFNNLLLLKNTLST